ncbi:hypothetical protein [Leptolyngbya ohadii]|uniref:hypothetical protein n=1 Tax=Leptolyngbya ohadii TaxID=1962290 RepID=UPI000B59DE53|nr:hypothetical protein [Leptolyngbya ohadii]
MPLSPLAKRTIWVSATAFLLSVGAGIGLRILGQAERPVEAQIPQAVPQQTPQAEPTPDPPPIPSPPLPQLDDRLKASVQLANQSRYAEALEQLDKIPANDPATAQAQTLREAWATQMLDRALAKYNEADIKGAITIALSIPPETETGRAVLQQLPTWRRQELIIDDALALIKSNPQQALARFKILADTPFAKSSRYQKWVEQAQAQNRWRQQQYSY